MYKVSMKVLYIGEINLRLTRKLKKWGSSWLPEEIIKERSKLIQDVYDYFIDGKAETDPHKQVNALFENEKFKEALTNVLVLAPS